MINSYLEIVALLGGGDVSPETVSEVLTLAPNLVACDGAARVALDLGHMPDLVIGDMDSLDAATRGKIDPARLKAMPDQDSTDFDKALRSISAPLVLAAGFMGRRVDHELAALNVLVRRAAQRCILVGEHDICFVVPPRLELHVAKDTRVSLFPMRDVVVSAKGLRWPLEALRLAPWARVGTSNAALGDVVIEPEGPGLLVFLPRNQLETAMRALRAAPVSAGSA
ncbi:MAG: thiamine diphosphokinase [Maritimibacter sp.]